MYSIVNKSIEMLDCLMLILDIYVVRIDIITFLVEYKMIVL